MKSFYKWSFFLLKWMLVAIIIGILISLGIFFFYFQFDSLGALMEAIVAVLVLLSSFIGLICAAIGIVIVAKRKKSKEHTALGKQMVLKGSGIVIIVLLIYFLQALALSFYGHT